MPTELGILTSIQPRDRRGTSVHYDLPPLIESARVIRVNAEAFLVDVVTDLTGRRARDLDVGGIGISPQGAMTGYMPQPGDYCLVVFPSDTTIPKILMYLPVLNRIDGARGYRMKMQPGDHVMSTEDGNYVAVRRGGIVDIAANPITRRMWVPVLNQIKDFCETYILNTAGGVLRWSNRRDALATTALGSGTELVWEIKESSKGQVVLVLRQGKVDTVKDMPDRAIDHKSVVDGGLELARVTVDRLGNLKVEYASANVKVRGDANLEVGGDVNLDVTGEYNVKATEGINLGGGTLESAALGESLVSALASFLTDVVTNAAAFVTPPSIPGPPPMQLNPLVVQAVSTLLAALKDSSLLAKDVKLS